MSWRTGVAAAAVALLLSGVASAQCVTVAPDICVSERKYNAPVNEQPFFGFAQKTPAMVDADQKFLAEALPPGTDKDRVVQRALVVGWDAFGKGDFVTAGRRFNQAFLLDPRRSGVYHSFAALVQERFGDAAYAEELFRVAKSLPKPMRALNADYGRLLMILRRPADALPVLEQGVKDAPEQADAWANLGAARLFTGDRAGACRAAAEAEKRNPDAKLRGQLPELRRQARCG